MERETAGEVTNVKGIHIVKVVEYFWGYDAHSCLTHFLNTFQFGHLDASTGSYPVFYSPFRLFHGSDGIFALENDEESMDVHLNVHMRRYFWGKPGKMLNYHRVGGFSYHLSSSSLPSSFVGLVLSNDRWGIVVHTYFWDLYIYAVCVRKKCEMKYLCVIGGRLIIEVHSDILLWSFWKCFTTGNKILNRHLVRVRFGNLIVKWYRIGWFGPLWQQQRSK